MCEWRGVIILASYYVLLFTLLTYIFPFQIEDKSPYLLVVVLFISRGLDILIYGSVTSCLFTNPPTGCRVEFIFLKKILGIGKSIINV